MAPGLAEEGSADQPQCLGPAGRGKGTTQPAWASTGQKGRPPPSLSEMAQQSEANRRPPAGPNPLDDFFEERRSGTAPEALGRYDAEAVPVRIIAAGKGQRGGLRQDGGHAAQAPVEARRSREPEHAHRSERRQAGGEARGENKKTARPEGPDPVSFFVKRLSMATISLRLNRGDSVGAIYDALKTKGCDLGPGRKLFYNGRRLQWENTLAEYDVQEGSTIYEEGQLLGGAGGSAVADETRRSFPRRMRPTG